MSAPAAVVPGPALVASRSGAAPVLVRAAARPVAFAALGLVGALHWATLVSPGAGGRMALAVGIATLAGAALPWSRRLRPAGRGPAAMAIAAAAVLAALLVAGVPLRMLRPGEWGALTGGLGDGLAALPELVVPYGGVDPWPRIVVLAGGTLLLVLAAALAFWPRRDMAGHPFAAAVVLSLLFAVPAVERTLDGQFARGGLFAVALLAWISLDRLDARRAPAAALAALLVAGTGLALAPRLDANRAWLDYEQVAESLAGGRSLSFAWNQTYGPLGYPREGRVVLRVSAPRASYWKAENLTAFDGVRWRADRVSVGSGEPRDEIPAAARARRGWSSTLTVSVRALRSEQVIGAGTILGVSRLGRGIEPGATPGTYIAARRALRRGDSYRVRVHVPRPRASELARDIGGLPEFTRGYRELLVPLGAGGAADQSPGARALVQFAPFGSGQSPSVIGVPSLFADGDAVLRRSAYAAHWALARRLAAASATPYEFVRRVEAHFARGFRYTETPPPEGRFPLEAFLERNHAGYCQQFSGSMALVLRMGGVPAQIAAGFTTGNRDSARGEWVVRDENAHTWVEAYFPRAGWVPFDPTPAAAPARGGNLIDPAGLGPIPGGRASLPERVGGGGTLGRGRAPQRGGEGPPWALIAVLVALVAALAALWRRLAARAPGEARDAQLAELERALERSGRALRPDTTLGELERRLGPGAADYLRALAERRFAAPGAPGPGAAERRELRDALGRGLGAAGRLRAWWALPPRPGRAA